MNQSCCTASCRPASSVCCSLVCAPAFHNRPNRLLASVEVRHRRPVGELSVAPPGKSRARGGRARQRDHRGDRASARGTAASAGVRLPCGAAAAHRLHRELTNAFDVPAVMYPPDMSLCLRSTSPGIALVLLSIGMSNAEFEFDSAHDYDLMFQDSPRLRITIGDKLLQPWRESAQAGWRRATSGSGV